MASFFDIFTRIGGSLVSRVMTALLQALGKLFDRMGEAKAQAVAQHAKDLAKVVEADPSIALTWFIAMYPDIKALLTAWPGVTKLVYVAHNVMSGQQVDRHTAITATQLAVNELKFEK